MQDLISREAAIKAIQERAGVDGFIDLPQEYVTDAIRALPSAQPKRKKGKWIKWEALNGLTYGSICSECGYITSAVPNYGTKYCPDCGADMRNKGERDE